MSQARKVGIVDYGAGNMASLTGALSRIGYRAVISREPAGLEGIDTIILPGVGSAGSAMGMLRKSGMDDFISEKHAEGKTRIIGICLGMQLFFDHSEEGDTACLGLLPGKTLTFPDRECHVGWSIVKGFGSASSDPNRAYYFNHSFYVKADKSLVTGRTDYLDGIDAIVESGTLAGVQFHPEKSQMVGQLLLRKLVED